MRLKALLYRKHKDESEQPTEMSEKTNGKLRLIEILLGILITISISWSGWCTLQIVDIEKSQAEMNRQILTNTGIIANILKEGSPGLAAHTKDDDSRVLALQQRMSLLESDLRYAMDLKNEVGKLGVRLDERLASIADRLRKLEENAAIIRKP